ncbi:hypothetical protein F442_17820 [Phytophthora nicotianae P10297]|uniref:Cyclic nucleotide-binding domain-containing protein n=2 Tax=Phytophthora nicotianae TaxID=4792 RepID=V9E9T9_PHYNI|nr:hypothetical protein F443_17978 [Phytophthora nicotianae P1569]ETP33688.1 hypothetical protein F442_17820 [Phytophthora nicotianae P10297]
MAAPASARKDGSIAVANVSGLPARVSLLQRGQNREQYLKTKVKATKPVGNRNLIRRATSRATAFTRSAKNMLSADDDHLDDLLTAVSESINAPENLSQGQQNALVLQAVLGLWTNRHQARGFRRWKESTLNRVDLQALIDAGVDVHEEARQLLLSAETKRRLLANQHRVSNDDDKWMAASFSYAELDLLLAWVRHTQPKTCRGVGDKTMREVLRYLRFSQYQEGEAIFFQGDKGDVFYLVLQGTVGIYGAKRTQPDKKRRGDSAASKRRSVSTREKPDMNLMGPRIFAYRAGESFGETAMFTNAAVRTATAIAFGDTTSGSGTGSVCELCELSRAVYSHTLKRFHQHSFMQAQRVNFAQRVFLFRDWPRPRVVELAEVLELRRISFGGVLLTGGVSPLSHCFFVLSGSVKLTTQIEINSHSDPSKSTVLKKAQRRAQVIIELHTVQVGEIVALEALLEEDDSARVTYTAVGGSADVEVYALKRTDGRAFLASSTTNSMHQIQAICTSERVHREQRINVARKALRAHETINKQHRLDLETEALELGLSEKQQQQRQKQQELEELNQPSPRGPVGLRPFLPHLDPMKLLDETKRPDTEPRGLNREIEIDTSLGEVAVPPKMLSTLVKNFVVRDWDTLSEDYAQRLTLKLPVRSPLSPLVNRAPLSLTCRYDAKVSTPTHTARRSHVPATISARISDERFTHDSHMRQLSMNYDAKMHWDPNKKTLVLLSANKPTQPQQKRAFGSFNVIANDHQTARKLPDTLVE